MEETHEKHLKAFVIAVFALLGLAVIILYFIFKPKPPVVIATPVSLLHFEFSLEPKITLSVTMGVDVYLKNPNLAPFTYQNSVAKVYYRDVCVGEAPIAAGKIGASATQDIGTPVELLVDKLISHPNFLDDATEGALNLISLSRTVGQATILGFVKLRALITVKCYVKVFMSKDTTTSKCISDIKI